ncbi:MAG: SHOCT domain-containing protein, partial [Dermatophilaceae bacterium]
MTAWTLAFWALVVVAIVALIQVVRNDRPRWPRRPKHDDPLGVLDERFARVEIDLEGHQTRRALLSKPRSLVTGRACTSKEELEIACSLYEVTWWEKDLTVATMRADAGAHPGLQGRLTAARNAGLVTTRDVHLTFRTSRGPFGPPLVGVSASLTGVVR